MRLLDIADRLVSELRPLRFASPVAYVYDPLEYARAPYAAYIERYGEQPRDVMLLGMNPGPFGMAQTGVPFGDVASVRDWLGIEAPVGKPPFEHPKRPVLGFDCPRGEVSGQRLWNWARERFGTAERFFARFFVANYCPLVFVEDSGRNRTPDRLPTAERTPLYAACDEALRQTVAHLRPRLVIGVGRFAEARARAALAGTGVAVETVLHPSPASPAANRGWAEAATTRFEQLGVLDG